MKRAIKQGNMAGDFRHIALANVPRALSRPDTTARLAAIQPDPDFGSFRMQLFERDAEGRFTGDVGEPVLITDANSEDAVATMLAMVLDGERLRPTLDKVSERGRPVPTTDGQWQFALRKPRGEGRLFNLDDVHFSDGTEVPKEFGMFGVRIPGKTITIVSPRNDLKDKVPVMGVRLPTGPTSLTAAIMTNGRIVTDNYGMRFTSAAESINSLQSLKRALGLDNDVPMSSVALKAAFHVADQLGINHSFSWHTGPTSERQQLTMNGDTLRPVTQEELPDEFGVESKVITARPFQMAPTNLSVVNINVSAETLTISIYAPWKNGKPALLALPEGLKIFWDIANGTA